MTVEQQLRKLPKPYDEMAIHETSTLTLSVESFGKLSLDLRASFVWSNSKLGFDFWYGIYLDAKHHNL